MTGCLACRFGGEIPRVPGTTIKNPCLIALWLLSLQFWLFTASAPKAFKQAVLQQGTKSLGASLVRFIYSFVKACRWNHEETLLRLAKGYACSQSSPELEGSKSACGAQWLSLHRAGPRSLCGFSACTRVSGSPRACPQLPGSCTGPRAPSCTHEMGQGFLPPARPASLPCTPLSLCMLLIRHLTCFDLIYIAVMWLWKYLLLP